MQLSDFDYTLPDELIARFPPPERRDSRLLEVGAEFADRTFSQLSECLSSGDLLVFNDTRVIAARLHAQKTTGGQAEILIERVTGERSALAHVRASKSPKPGSTLQIAADVAADVVARQGPLFELQFSLAIDSVLAAHGEMPLPPYLGRDAESADDERYQTVYARTPGAVAAPTAGLHFDEQMLAETRAAGIEHAYVTLHVGAGTFQSLRHQQVADNRLHAERVLVDENCVAAVARTRARGGRVIAVGTTAVRSLECAAQDGVLQAFCGETELFIVPGYRFNCVDAILTNFHLPQSSLLMLVAAFAGHARILEAYRHAVRERYRFFSYGDCMLLHPESKA